MVELTDLRDAQSRTFEHPGGARTVDAYAEPIHYEDQHGSWMPIDNTLRDEPTRPGWVASSGNAFTVALGPLEDGIEVSAGSSTLRMTPVLDLAEDEVGGARGNPAGDNFLYDSAGRLTEAMVPGASYQYGFGPAVDCDVTNVGANTNRTSLTITGVGAVNRTSCFDHADRLVSTSDISAGDIAYDDRGNATQLGDERLVFDSAARHVTTITPSDVTRYLRDPLDRIVERHDSPRIAHVATSTATSGATSVSINRPAGTEEGDLMIAAISTSAVDLLLGAATSAGWTAIRSETNLPNRTTVLWRYATNSDPPSWTFASSAVLPLLPASTGAISTYRATAGSMPIATHAGATGLLTDSHPVPQVTTTSGAAHLVHISGFAGATTASPAAGTTQRAAVSASASLLVADRLQVDPGAPPTNPVTTGGLFNSASVTVAISAVNTRSLIAYDGHSDNPQFTAAPTGGVIDFTIPLAGGALFTWNDSNGYEISHTNWHGDTVTITDLNGDRVWTGITGPHGEQASSSDPMNSGMDGVRWGWHAADQRMTDRTITQMGARLYSSEHGRFLSVDPQEGGCANDYTYVYGDPLNTNDIYGTNWLTRAWDATGGRVVSVIADQVLTCQATGFTEAAGALSLLTPGNSGGTTEKRWAGNAAGLIGFNVGNLVGAVAKGQIGGVYAKGIAGTIVRVGARSLNAVTYAATAYDAGRRFICRDR